MLSSLVDAMDLLQKLFPVAKEKEPFDEVIEIFNIYDYLYWLDRHVKFFFLPIYSMIQSTFSFPFFL